MRPERTGQVEQMTETAPQWVELRDDRGKLCARLEVHRGLLEMRRNGQSATFDLGEYLRIRISEY